jgi:hypothetical protein
VFNVCLLDHGRLVDGTVRGSLFSLICRFCVSTCCLVVLITL